MLAVCVFHVCVLSKNNLPFVKTVLNLLCYFISSFVNFVALLHANVCIFCFPRQRMQQGSGVEAESFAFRYSRFLPFLSQ